MIKISKIQKGDLSDLASLFEELVDKKTDIIKMKESFQKLDYDPNVILIGAKENGNLLGSIMGIICHDVVGECRPFMVIENFVVTDKERGKGIGKKLITVLEEQAKHRNCNYAILVSSGERDLAHQFYESNGYYSKSQKGYKKYF